MFVLEEYKAYLISNMRLQYFKNANCKFTKEDFIYSLTDFKSSGHGSRLGSRPGDQIKSLFPTISQDKPRSVSYTKYFLFNYGYKYCTKCEQVKKLSLYSADKNSWNKLFAICKECDSKRGVKYYDANKEKLKESYLVWYENNSHIRTAYQAKRRAIKKQATPKWLDLAQKKEIILLYKTAKENNMQVDHIVPLKGKYVSGLHVPWNLQLLSIEANIKKNNYHESEEYWKNEHCNIL
jgi:5-methylcytosine-specific restriction endonuclease McrA